MDKGKIEDRLKDTFRPEFLNRVDEIVVFNSLNKEQLLQIVDLMLEDTKKVLLEKDITLQVSDKSKEIILEKGTNLKYGARPLRRAIQRFVEDDISEKILRGEISNGQEIVIELDEDKLNIYAK